MAERQVIGLPELGDLVRWRGRSTTYNGQVTRIFCTQGQPDRYEVEWFFPVVLDSGNTINECGADDLAVVKRSEEHRMYEALRQENRLLRIQVAALHANLRAARFVRGERKGT